MKLHIFGASGTGVTTLGQALAVKLNVPYFDSDDYFWKMSDPPFTIKQQREERNAQIKTDLGKAENWVLGGSVIHWGDDVFPTFDLIVFLYLPTDIRIERLRKREWERYGDIIYTDPLRAKQFQDFINWAADYDNNSGLATRTLQAHEDWMAKVDSPILRIADDLTTEERMQLVIARLHA